MTPRWRSGLTGSEVYEGDARIVAQTLPVGSVTCSILDGPYNLGKAEWDRVPRGGTLGDLYTGHLDDVNRLSAQSASLYVWNTSQGWAELHPLILARGWTFRSLIVWHKPDGCAIRAAHEEGARTWPEVMEVCGFYQREEWAPSTCAGSEIAHAAGQDARNPMTTFWTAERESAGLTRKQLSAAFPSRSGNLTGCVTNWEEGYNYPTWEVWQTAAAFMQSAAPRSPDERPYLVHPSQWPVGGLRASYDHLRAEYEASRPPFTCPLGVGNVWTQGAVAGSERLRTDKGVTLHPCQKPLLFAERMIKASSRPGDTVWVPFGGTLREMVANERLSRSKQSDARKVISCELNADGKDYIGPAIAQAQGLPTQTTNQTGLFG